VEGDAEKTACAAFGADGQPVPVEIVLPPRTPTEVREVSVLGVHLGQHAVREENVHGSPPCARGRGQ
jgi:hypothetical protein